jgi:hypothetical protein
MAAFLTVDFLRAHAASEHPNAVFGQPGRPLWAAPAPQPRPRLVARWLVAEDGRLTCRWQIDASAPFGPPSH